MTTDWYAPNQQCVRADGSGPAEEGTGGQDAGATAASERQDTEPKSKEQDPQVDPARASWSKPTKGSKR